MNEEKDKEVRQTMQRIGKAVESQIPDGYGFFVLVFPFNDSKGRANYCSNGKREDVLNTMKEFLVQAGHKEDWMMHI